MRIPGGGIIPGGGPLIGIPGGGPMPGGGIGGRIPGGGGPEGAPTPLPGPASPGAGYYPIGASYTALPIGCAFPGPACAAPSATLLYADEGGASALIVTMFSPLNRTNPSALFYSRSFSSGLFGFIFLYSSVSASTRFICLSKAIKVPTSIRES
jgi:hypothetical protein